MFCFVLSLLGIAAGVKGGYEGGLGGEQNWESHDVKSPQTIKLFFLKRKYIPRLSKGLLLQKAVLLPERLC